ncbi:exopolysaccharide biosynthesis protein [Ideonella sp. A 288]|uniref:exopolysaccharide biosynthesis protein n=1 Tax=Ideonella sp. A 288 TaxID=1962181 RepID=UPI000B4BFEC9|nr:exopolysaccharide biosynthesis protein [Ideonella sp. A 288]
MIGTIGDSGSKIPLSAVLHALAQDDSRERIAVSDLLAALGDRALAALLFVFAVPNVLPVPPGTSILLGAPLIFLAAQLALGRGPWLPAVIARRTMTRTDFATVVRRIGPWLARAERLLRPRAMGLALPPMEYLIGLVCLVLAVVLVLPVPLGNMLPALAISLLALGILERDGLWVLAGLAAAAVSAVVVSGVVFAMVKATVFFFTEVLR